MEETTIVRGLISSLKITDKPNSSDLIDIPDKVMGLVKKLPTLFRKQPIIATPIREQIIEFNGSNNYHQKYLLVLGTLTKVIGTQLYMKEMLQQDTINTCKRIIIIGHQSEVALMYHIARYLYTMHERIYERVRPNRPHNLHPAQFREKYTHTFFMSIYLQFPIGYLFHRGQFENLKNRDSKVLTYIINNFIFEHNNIRNDTSLGQTFIITKYQVTDGKFTNHKLLWH